MEQEKIDLEKVLVIANNLKQLANDLESILNKNTNDINNLNTKEYYLSPAAAKILDKYLNNITKFNRYKEEIINYANILELKNEAYLKNRDNATKEVLESSEYYLNKLLDLGGVK